MPAIRRALRQFYETVFGWEFEQWGEIPYWVIRTGEGPGVDGGLLPRQDAGPAEGQSVNAFVMTIEVPDCDATVETALASGGSVALPADDMPGVGRLAYLKDPDGNIFGVLKPEG